MRRTPFPDELLRYVREQKWTFAKTYADTWPHEYIVREKRHEELFLALIQHIRTYGYQGRFYNKEITYYEQDGLVYWTMGAPAEETTIINRCRRDQTYDYRRAHGNLPTQNGRQEDEC